MTGRLLKIGLVIFIAQLLLVGTVWAIGTGTAVSPSTPGDAPYPDQRQAVSAGVTWLVTTHQNDDGGYSDFSTGANQSPSGIAGTMDAILAIAAAGHNPAATYPGKTTTPLTYLQGNPADIAAFAGSGGGPAGKVVLALTAANQDPRDFLGHNFVISLTDHLSPSGEYNAGTAFNQSLALLALTAVDESVPLAATQWLKDQQAINGSWDDGFGTVDNPDATSMAIMALVAAGEAINGTILTNAVAFLDVSQLATGDWEYGTAFGGNANSTALALQALSAVGEDFYTVGGPWDQNGSSPLLALLAYQNTTGAFQSDFGLGPFDDFFATVQSLPAATGRPFPLPARYEAARRAVNCLATLQDVTSGGWEQFAGVGVNAGGTSRAIEAIAAIGDDPQSTAWTPGSVNAVDALEALTPDYLSAGRGGRVGIVMQGVVAAGAPYSVTNFAGFNLPLSVTNYLSPGGEYDDTAFGPQAHNEAILGLTTAGYAPDPTAVSWLQNAASGGSWGGPDADGSAINVLSRLDADIPQGAFINLRQTQETDGGWGFGVPASINSTAEVALGLVEHGDNPFAPAWSVVFSGTIQNAADPVLQQQGESGCWPNLFGPGADPFATTDGILLLLANPTWSDQVGYLEMLIYLPVIGSPEVE